jgi:DNA-binding GntR family transcriptional regulator
MIVCLSLMISNRGFSLSAPGEQSGDGLTGGRRAAGRESSRRSLVAGPAPRTSLGDVVAERLRQAILNDEFSPGQHLREEEISESLDVSRGPVRDAFLILEREGLVRLSRHRGATVVEFLLEDLGEVYSLRSALESLAVRLAIRRHEPADIQDLHDSLTELQVAMRRKTTEQSAAQLDVNFHDCIFRAAHHERLYQSWSNIRMQVYWFLLSRNVAGPDWRKNMAKNHGRILDLIEAGDEVKAVDATGEHIRAAYTRIWSELAEPAPSVQMTPSQLDTAKSFLLE